MTGRHKAGKASAVSCGLWCREYTLPKAETLGILDVPSFVRVAYIHNASYLGGLIGLIAAIIYVRRRRNTEQARAVHGNMPARSEADQSPSAPDPLKPH
jgi:hypothetical protein